MPKTGYGLQVVSGPRSWRQVGALLMLAALLAPAAVPTSHGEETPGPGRPADDGTSFEVLQVERHDFYSHDGTRIAVAVWRPDVPGDQRVPVIMAASPYYGTFLEQMGPSDEEVFYDHIIPRGFAYARVAIRGTSESEGCMEFMSPAEQKDIDHAVTILAQKSWSSGRVGMVGVSYVGTTPWVAASFGNPHLDTIVPIAGITDWHELLFRNGTSQAQGPIQSEHYWAGKGLGIMPSPLGFWLPAERIEKWPEQACEQAVRGAVEGPVASLTGQRDHLSTGYWLDRGWREKVAADYRGSVFVVHGLRDLIVDAGQAYPFINQLEAQGIQVQHLVGQWQHSLPDTPPDTQWKEILFAWFDRELRDGDVWQWPNAAWVQDSAGSWRSADSWPPQDAVQRPLYLGKGTLLDQEGTEGRAWLFDPIGASNACAWAFSSPECRPLDETTELRFELPAVSKDLHVSGIAHLDLTVTPTSPAGGRLFVELHMDAPEHWWSDRVAHAVMDLRYHDGGKEAHVLEPGQPIQARFEFYPTEFVVPAGERLTLRIAPGNGPLDGIGMLPSPAPAPMQVHWGGGQSVLELPVLAE